MQKLFRRGGSIFLSLALLLGTLPVYAAEIETSESPLVLAIAAPSEDGTYPVGEEVIVNTIVEITGGKIESTNGVSAVAIINGVNSGEITFSGTAELISTSAAALNIGCSLNENNLKLLLDGNVKYDGATYAIYITESEAVGGYYKTLPKIEIKGGQFACGDEYILISDTSSVVFVDDTYVFNTREKANGAKYLSLVTKDSLAGTYYPNEGTQLNPIPYSYQDFEGNRDGSGQGLDDLLDQAKQKLSSRFAR